MILTHTISLPELLWTVWCTAGLIFLLKLTRDAVRDWQWVIHSNHNGVREYAAINSVIVFCSMTLTQLVFVIIGLIAMMQVPAVQDQVSPLTYVIAGLFMLASASKTVFAIILVVRKENLVGKIEDGTWVYKERNEDSLPH